MALYNDEMAGMGGGGFMRLRPLASAPNIMQKYGMPGEGGGNFAQAGLAGQLNPLVSAMAGGGGQPTARQQLIGPLQLSQAMAGRPNGVATGMGMTPPSASPMNPALAPLAKSEQANNIMRKYGMMGR